nr:MAG TPA: hypothetical protein [Bacteriophage sp.]
MSFISKFFTTKNIVSARFDRLPARFEREEGDKIDRLPARFGTLTI